MIVKGRNIIQPIVEVRKDETGLSIRIDCAVIGETWVEIKLAPGELLWEGVTTYTGEKTGVCYPDQE